jgi:hypothetical protein
MNSQLLEKNTCAAAESAETLTPAPAETARVLPSGRSVVLRLGPDAEAIEVRSPEGEVEVSITLTDQGPVVRLRAAQLQLQAADAVEVKCRHFAVHADASAQLQTGGDLQLGAEGDLHIKTEQDTHINGRMIYLNC